MPRASWACIGVLAYAATFGVLNDLLAPAAVTAVVYWSAIAGSRLPRVGKYGDFSYGLYLYHFPIVQSFIALGLFAAAPLLSAITVFLAAIVTGIASWFLVEHPSLQRKAVLRTALG
jgi:peptidoglycan/LPS O-acetylase OafA/YrhL